MPAIISGELRNSGRPHDNRPRVKIKVAGFCEQIHADKPVVDAVLDTGFAGEIIVPAFLKDSISKDCLIPLAEKDCPRYVAYGSQKGVPHFETYTMLRIAILNEDEGWNEFFPEYVSFANTDHALIGIDFFIRTKGTLTIDGNARRFSMRV